MVDIQIRNKELVEKYPWLCPERKDDGAIADCYDYSYTEIDFLPTGWHSIVLEMCEKLKPILEEHGLLDTYALSEYLPSSAPSLTIASRNSVIT